MSHYTLAGPDPTTITLLLEDDSLRQQLLGVLQAIQPRRLSPADHPGDAADQTPDDRLIILHAPSGVGEILDLARESRELFPAAPIITIWPTNVPGDARRAIRAGVSGIVRDSDLETTLPLAISAVRSGLTSIPHEMRGPLQAESLSSREKQMLGLVVTGLSNAEIAAKLFLAESTVKSHLSSAYGKLGVRSRKDAASLILDPVGGLGPGILAIAAG